MRILIIDDDEDICEMLALLLEVEGHDVITAGDGVAGLEQLRADGRPSLILLDMMMPRLDGEGFLKALRSDPNTADIPVVFLTGHPSGRTKAAQLGTLGCLVKPVELKDLMRTVQQAEHRSRA
jgi:two-component system chemotaxis response regulator CheY